MLTHARAVSERKIILIPSQGFSILYHRTDNVGRASVLGARLGLRLLGLDGDKIKRKCVVESQCHRSRRLSGSHIRYRYWVLWSRARIVIQLRHHQNLGLGNITGKDIATKAGTTIRMFRLIPPERVPRSGIHYWHKRASGGGGRGLPL